MVNEQSIRIDLQTVTQTAMKSWAICFGAGAILALFAASVVAPQERLIWNRTKSAPIGLYWVQNNQPKLGDLALVSPDSEQAVWANENGFIGKDWPLLKYVSGQPGDEICRQADEIFINGKRVSVALSNDARGRKLPAWQGCRRLSEGEVFLLNPHPKSLDGRYFGVTNIEDLDGVAVLLFESRSTQPSKADQRRSNAID